MAFGGKGIARVETEKGPFVVFVQNAFPGQVVDAQVAKCKARHAECRLLRVVEPADFEVDLPYQPIPGAPYATVPMEKQHEWKARTALDLYRKIGEVEDLDTLYEGFVPSPLDWHYRNKMEYSFSEIRHDLETDEKVDDFGLGFSHRGTWWAVETSMRTAASSTLLWNPPCTKCEWCKATGLPAWHPPKREGFSASWWCERVMQNDGLLVNLVTTSDAPLMRKALWNAFGGCGATASRASCTPSTTTKENASRPARDRHVIWGDSTVTEVLHGLSFGISMGSFFQTNPTSAERLYAEVLALALEGVENRPQDVIMDLFCGTGTIGQLVAKHANKPVVGVDIVPSAIEDAREAAKRNGLTGVEFVAADAGKFLLENPEYQGKIHTVILDPPRAGISPKTLRKVMRLGAQRLVYVSCNPATQARDLVVLRAQGYALKSLKLVDQFPHTAHVEAVALIEKIRGFQPNLEA